MSRTYHSGARAERSSIRAMLRRLKAQGKVYVSIDQFLVWLSGRKSRYGKRRGGL